MKADVVLYALLGLMAGALLGMSVDLHNLVQAVADLAVAVGE